MELGVEHVVGDALPLQQTAEDLTFFDGHGAHQHGLSLGVAALDLLHDGPVLAGDVLVHHIRVVDPGDGLVGGDLHHVQGVDGAEFFFFRQGGAGHAGELVIETEEILEGDRGQSLALAGDPDVLLGFDGLVQAFVVPTAVHETAGELVHDDDFPILHHVVDVLLHQAPGLHGLVDVVGDGGVFGIGQVFQAEILLRLGNARGGQRHGAALFVHIIVAVQIVMDRLVLSLGEDLSAQTGHEEIGHFIELAGILALAGDDQGGPGFVDQNGVHLVHDGEGMAPLDQILLVDRHVVPEVVEAQLVVGAVGDVRSVADPALIAVHAGDDQAHTQTHVAVDLAHPFGVTLGQVLVDRDHVDTPARQGVEVAGQNGDQGLAFAGLHFRDAALMEYDAAQNLHRVGLHAQHPPGGLPDGSEGLGQQVVQAFAPGVAVLEFGGLALQLRLGQGGEPVLQGQDLVLQGLQLLDLPLGTGTENLIQKSHIVAPLQMRVHICNCRGGPCPRRPGIDFRDVTICRQKTTITCHCEPQSGAPQGGLSCLLGNSPPGNLPVDGREI